MMTNFVGAVFVTPLHTTIRVYDQDRQPVSEQFRLNTDCLNGREHLLRIASALKAEARKFAPDAKFTEAGIAVAGQIRHGVVVQASRLHSWKNVAIEKIVAQALGGARVAVGNDAEARTRWEAIYNPIVSGSPFMTVYWGEGVGGAYSDYHGKITPLEPGHVPVRGVASHQLLPCFCSTHPGCLDAHAGGARIAEELRKSGSRFLSIDAAIGYADLVAGVVAKLLESHHSDFIVVGGQRLKLHDNLGKGNPSLTAFLEQQLRVHVKNPYLRPRLVRSDLWYAPADTALTLLDRSHKSLAAIR